VDGLVYFFFDLFLVDYNLWGMVLLLWLCILIALGIDLHLVVLMLEISRWMWTIATLLFGGCELWNKKLFNICLALRCALGNKAKFIFPKLIVCTILVMEIIG
jgi:hypothetical protein